MRAVAPPAGTVALACRWMREHGVRVCTLSAGKRGGCVRVLSRALDGTFALTRAMNMVNR